MESIELRITESCTTSICYHTTRRISHMGAMDVILELFHWKKISLVKFEVAAGKPRIRVRVL